MNDRWMNDSGMNDRLMNDGWMDDRWMNDRWMNDRYMDDRWMNKGVMDDDRWMDEQIGVGWPYGGRMDRKKEPLTPNHNPNLNPNP